MAPRKSVLQVDLHVRFEHVVPLRHSDDEFGCDDVLCQRRPQAKSLLPTKSHSEVLYRLLLRIGGGGICCGGDGCDYGIRFVRCAVVQRKNER